MILCIAQLFYLTLEISDTLIKVLEHKLPQHIAVTQANSVSILIKHYLINHSPVIKHR